MPPGASEQTTFVEAVSYLGERVTEALSVIDPRHIQRAVELITSAPTIFVYGAGRSGIIARALAMRLVQVGLRAFVIGESVTPIVMRGDLVIIFSNRGESYSSNQTANIVRREGANLIVVTAKPTSKLAHAATLSIALSLPDDERRPQLAPLGTLFEASSLRFSDGLVAEIMRARGEDEESLRRRHAIMV